MTTVLEGGSNYWAKRVTAGYSEKTHLLKLDTFYEASRQKDINPLLFKVQYSENNDEVSDLKTVEVYLNDVIDGMKMSPPWLQRLLVNREILDAEQADVLFQMIVLKNITFG